VDPRGFPTTLPETLRQMQKGRLAVMHIYDLIKLAPLSLVLAACGGVSVGGASLPAVCDDAGTPTEIDAGPAFDAASDAQDASPVPADGDASPDAPGGCVELATNDLCVVPTLRAMTRFRDDSLP